MITEDQLEQLAIQWFQDTGWSYANGADLAPEGVAAEREALRTLTPALSHWEKEEDRRLAGVRRRVAMPGRVVHGVTKAVRRMCRPFRAWNPVVDGTQGVALGCRMVPRWGRRTGPMRPSGARRRRPTIKGDLMARYGGGGRATCKGCLQVQMERTACHE